jgi:glycine C-acetyltransferase
MKYKGIQNHLSGILNNLAKRHLVKEENLVTSPISHKISTSTFRYLIDFSSSDYLGFANDARINEVAKKSLLTKGYGLSSVRFICGTTDSHKALESEISAFYETEDTILFPSAYAANSAIFEVLLSEEDAVMSDSFNHESIVHGIRLSKAQRFVYKNNDMNDLEAKLKDSEKARFKIIVSNSIFSSTGEFANIQEMSKIAEENGAILMIDEGHGTGTVGIKGRGVCELSSSLGKIEIITSTLEKSLGGGNGGFVTGKQEIIDLLRQRARPYLFSNSISTYTVEASRLALKLLRENSDLVLKIQDNIQYFRQEMRALGFNVLGDPRCAICPILVKNEAKASNVSEELRKKGIYALPSDSANVPSELISVRIQIKASHTRDDLQNCIEAFKDIGRQYNLINK